MIATATAAAALSNHHRLVSCHLQKLAPNDGETVDQSSWRLKYTAANPPKKKEI